MGRESTTEPQTYEQAERAAILEYDGGHTREQAEIIAQYEITQRRQNQGSMVVLKTRSQATSQHHASKVGD